MGQSYLLACPEGGESRLLEAVERVDTAMCKIREAGKVKARERIAVLAALNLAFDLAVDAARAAPLSTQMAASGEPQGLSQPGNDPTLSALLERLNGALSEDGRLL